MGIIPFADILGCEINFTYGMLGDVSGKRAYLEFIRSRGNDIEVTGYPRSSKGIPSDEG